MNIHRRLLGLRIATIVLVCVAVITVVIAVVLPIHTAASLPLAVPHESVTSLPTTTPADAVPDFSDLTNVDLRRPLVDSAPTSKIATETLLRLRLTGTIIESLQKYAVFTNDAGQCEIKSVGDQAAGADVTAIDRDSVTLRFNGRSVVLHIAKPSSIGQPSS